MFITTMLISLLLLAAIGWATYWLHQHHGTSGEQVFRAALALLVSGLVLVFTFATNYVLASSGLKRSMASERFMSGDPIAKLFFGGSHLRTNHLLALMVVIASFVSTACCLRAIGTCFDMIRGGTWRRDRHTLVRNICRVAFLAAVAGFCLWLDTTMLLSRTALMMYSNDYAGSGPEMPTPALIIHGHGEQIGGLLLSIFTLWYPLYIVMAEKHYASCKAHFSEACRLLVLSRAQAEAGLPAIAGHAAPEDGGLPPAAPVPAPDLGRDRQAAPPPPIPVVVPGRPPRIDPDTPLPGGAQFVRPVPFNMGPAERNGHG